MNKTRFRLLVFFMSLSLVGIILVQLYWVNLSFKNSEEQFQYRAQNILNKVSDKIKDEEEEKFLKVFDNYRDSIGHEPTRNELLSFYVASNKKIRSVLSTKGSNDSNVSNKQRKKKSETKNYEIRPHLNNIELFLKDFREYNSVESWVSKTKVQEWISSELESKKIKTDVEFAIYKKSQPTKIESDNFRYIENNLEEDQIFDDKQARVALILSFPKKETFLINEILGITLLSIIFTMVIIIAYLSAINQLIKQKQISEIKTDFINNMTHEFKTPIATINLALDAIKNPKIFIDPEKVQRYLQMIRDENKRMHAQVENVLQISKLDKRELDIPKDQADIHDVLEEAIEHVYLIIEARHGTLKRHFNALRTTALLNDVHFTNVLVNILDNAIKYSPDEPVIDIYTENVKEFILIKIKDNGLGMSKVTQKRIFEKFYREHTGDIHNVKGHGLGLAYVKRIIDDHNCHIYVESEKGKGSTFIIKMPLIN
jgi:two-component system phosphate regulon sensor histidine kinase PhoR